MAKIVFDENRLTIGDMEDFEEVTGQELTKALKPVAVRDDDGKIVRDEKGKPEQTVEMPAKVLKALVWIANRHDNPNFSLTDARNVKVTELDIIREGESEEVDPKD